MKFLLFLLASTSLLASAAAQPTVPTAQLWQALRQHPQADRRRVDLLNQLADYETVDGLASDLPNPERDSLAQQAEQLAQRLHYPFGEAYAQFSPGPRTDARGKLGWWQHVMLPLAERSGNAQLLVRTLLRTGRYAERQALPYLQRATALAQAPALASQLVRAYEMQGSYFRYIAGDYYQALRAQEASVQAARTAHLAGGEAIALVLLGNIYLDAQDYEQARRYFQQALRASARCEQATTRAYVTQVSLNNLADVYRLTNHYAQALALYHRVLALQPTELARLAVTGGIADIYERQRNPLVLALAQPALRQARTRARRYSGGDDTQTAQALTLTLGQYYLHAGRADSAVAYGQQSLQLAQQLNDKSQERDVAQLLAQAYAQRHAYGRAYALLQHYVGLRDTLNSEQVTRRITAARFTLDLARQRSQIGLLTRNQQLQAAATQRQRLLLLAALAIGLLLAGLAAIFWRATRQRQRANTLLQQQKAQLQQQRDHTTQALTELRTTQQQLIQKEKMASLGELTAGIAHEIQNPLNFVTNFSDVSVELVSELQAAQVAGDAAEVGALAEDLGQNLRKISQHGQRASGIVRGMLAHSRASTGEHQPTNLTQLADESLRLAYQGWRAKDPAVQVELQLELAPDLPLVEAVPGDLGRVLLNLLTNAFYAVQQRQRAGEAGYVPTVRVCTRQVGLHVQVLVQDNGTGMRPEVQAKVFQPFFTTKPTGEGTGLGLSLSYDIVTRGHGGTLTVASEPGHGSTFTIQLPMLVKGQSEPA